MGRFTNTSSERFAPIRTWEVSRFFQARNESHPKSRLYFAYAPCYEMAPDFNRRLYRYHCGATCVAGFRGRCHSKQPDYRQSRGSGVLADGGLRVLVRSRRAYWASREAHVRGNSRPDCCRLSRSRSYMVFLFQPWLPHFLVSAEAASPSEGQRQLLICVTGHLPGDR